MKFGFTYDLRSDYLARGFSEEETAEFDRPDTIDAIDAALSALGHQVVRIGSVQSLVEKLARNERWDMVFNICEGMYGISREAQVPTLLEAYNIPYVFSDPLVLNLTLHKGMAKRVVRDLGIATPDFHVVSEPSEAERVNLPYPLFVKPVAEGTGKGVGADSKATNRKELIDICQKIIKKYAQPALVETYLPGREFTVGIAGTGADAEVLGTVEVLLKGEAEAHAYSYVNKEKCEDLVIYELLDDDDAKASAALALAAWRGLGCRDGGRIDVRLDAQGQPSFIEVNPLAGLNPQHSDLPIICTQAGIPYNELIRRIIESAQLRLPHR